VAIKLKSPREIEAMRRAGLVVAAVLRRLSEMAAVGVTTAQLDAEADRMTTEMGAEPLFRGVPGRGGPFPGVICASLNEQLVHGIPSGRAIRDGDIVSIDYGCRLDGYCGDAAVTVAVGQVAPVTLKLLTVTKQTLDLAIEMCRPGVLWSTVARAMQQVVEDAGFSVVREFVGHGIGREMWEDPKVPNFVSRELLARDILLEEGLVLAVEPMVCMGSPEVSITKDGWTVVTRDGKPSGHFEHTLAITAGGVRVLTQEA
jgi:methionyl aminopeptidase